MVITILDFSLLLLANVIGSSITLFCFLPHIKKELKRNIGRNIGREFARGIDEHYEKNEQNIKRKPI